ncbi:MAG: N-acetyl-gamma-glutamyl-phosphate reductase [Acidimicrobiales bacterium]
MKVGIVGASGYTGAELLRLCASHPGLDVALAGADTQAGQEVGELYPSLAAVYGDMRFVAAEPADLAGLDVVFLALPHGASERYVVALDGRVRLLVDLSADFRLRDPALYRKWYGREHGAPELLARFAYGLPELFYDGLTDTGLIASPGCYPTAAALALVPLVRAGVIEAEGVVVDAASGVSGAGRGLASSTQFAAADENFTAYGLLNHRHTPEIEQATGATVLFTPHLAPMSRGILATCYARPARTAGDMDTSGAMEVLRETYRDSAFVVVADTPPSTKATMGSNCAHLTVRVDDRTGWVLVLCAIDNLVKGASGQAVQAANIALGLEEAAGLPRTGIYP